MIFINHKYFAFLKFLLLIYQKGVNMADKMIKECKKLLKVSIKEQTSLLKLIPKAFLAGKFEFHEYREQKFHTLKQMYPTMDKKILNHCALIQALDKFNKELSGVEKKWLKKFDEIPKENVWDILLQNISIINELNNLGLGYRKISIELEKQKIVSASHTYVGKAYRFCNNKK